MRILQPPDWARPRGYANGVLAEGSLIFVAGQIGWDTQNVFRTDDFSAQVAQALRNTLAILAEADAGPQHVVRMTWFVTSRDEYLASVAALGAVWREIMGRHYPAMSVVAVSALMELRARVEIETTAVLPNR